MTRKEKREFKAQAERIEQLQSRFDAMLQENGDLNEIVMARNIRHQQDEEMLRHLRKRAEELGKELDAERTRARISAQGLRIEQAELQARADRLELRINGLGFNGLGNR